MKPARSPRLFVEVDMEGVSGAVFGGYGLPPSKEARRCELLMTLELNALVEGARAEGVENLFVCESHRFNRDHLIRGINIVHKMDQIKDCDALAFVGRHARAGLEKAVLSHTGSGRSVLDLKVNGVSFGEFGIVAAYAGHFGVPAIFVAGDRAAVDEARALVPNIGTAAVSEGLGNHSAVCLAPGKSRQVIMAGIREALRNRKNIRPLVVRKPVAVEYVFKNAALADRCALVPGVTKKDARTIVFSGKDFAEVYRTYLATSLALIWCDSK